MSFNHSAISFVPAATIALMALFSSIEHANKVLRIQCAFRAFRARNTLQYLKQLAAYTESINTPEHHAAVRKIQKALRCAIPKARAHHLCILYNNYTFPDTRSGGSVDQAGCMVVTIENGYAAIGQIHEDGSVVDGRYAFGKFYPEAPTDDVEYTDDVEEQMNAELFAYMMEVEDLLKRKEHSPRLWELINLLYTMDSADTVTELCERYGFNPCNYSNKCGNRNCKNDHPFGTDLQKNLETYMASKKAPSSSESVSSDITDDGNSSILLSQPTTDSSNFDAKAEEFISKPSVTEALGESCSKKNLLEYLDSDEDDFSALVELFKVPDRIKLKALRKIRLSSQATVETKSSAPPQQVGGGAIQSTYCKNWQKTGTCSFGERCHNKAFHVSKATKTATPCHNKAFKSGKDCDWANCILCHDRATTLQAQPAAQVQVPAAKPKRRL